MQPTHSWSWSVVDAHLGPSAGIGIRKCLPEWSGCEYAHGEHTHWQSWDRCQHCLVRATRTRTRTRCSRPGARAAAAAQAPMAQAYTHATCITRGGERPIACARSAGRARCEAPAADRTTECRSETAAHARGGGAPRSGSAEQKRRQCRVAAAVVRRSKAALKRRQLARAHAVRRGGAGMSSFRAVIVGQHVACSAVATIIVVSICPHTISPANPESPCPIAHTAAATAAAVTSRHRMVLPRRVVGHGGDAQTCAPPAHGPRWWRVHRGTRGTRCARHHAAPRRRAVPEKPLPRRHQRQWTSRRPSPQRRSCAKEGGRGARA